MTEINEFECVCLRCLRNDETAEIAGPEKVIADCARCGTENWCLKIKVAREAVEATEGTSEEVTESIPILTKEGVGVEEAESVEEAVSKAQKKREALIAKKRAELEELENLG